MPEVLARLLPFSLADSGGVAVHGRPERPMPPKDLGTKHACWKCGTRFYDLKKAAPICPKCGADARESPALKAPPEKRVRAAPKPEPAEEAEPAEEGAPEKDLEEGGLEEEAEEADDEG
jgi:uncharacterized protein (TIGR02300 family)